MILVLLAVLSSFNLLLISNSFVSFFMSPGSFCCVVSVCEPVFSVFAACFFLLCQHGNLATHAIQRNSNCINSNKMAVKRHQQNKKHVVQDDNFIDSVTELKNDLLFSREDRSLLHHTCYYRDGGMFPWHWSCVCVLSVYLVCVLKEKDYQVVNLTHRNRAYQPDTVYSVSCISIFVRTN